MDLDLGVLSIENIIVHEVPQRMKGSQAGPPQLTEAVSPLNQDIRNYFKQKISQSLGSSGLDVVFESSASSPIPQLVLDNLGPRTIEFVDLSQRMALHLFQIQNGVNPAGLLIVI